MLRSGGRHSRFSITHLQNRQLWPVVHGRAQDRVICSVLLLNESRTHLEPARERVLRPPQLPKRACQQGPPRDTGPAQPPPPGCSARPAFRTPFLVVIHLHPEDWGLGLLQSVHWSGESPAASLSWDCSRGPSTPFSPPQLQGSLGAPRFPLAPPPGSSLCRSPPGPDLEGIGGAWWRV